MVFVFPTDYGSNYRPASVDFEEGIVVFVSAIVLISICVGVTGPDPVHRLRSWSITMASCCVGGVIWGMGISREWESASVNTRVLLPDKGGRFSPCNVTIGLHIGLRGVNVTMASGDVNCSAFFFDEQFDWAWKQGRFGFGMYAGQYPRDFREGQTRGYPLPILSVAEMLLLDGEGIRWGRMYRVAGWHVHSLLQYALGFWLLFFICIHISLAPAAYTLAMVGLLLLVSGSLWLGLSPATTTVHFPKVVFADQVLTPEPGAALILCLVTGLFSLLISAIILVMDARFPLATANFFGLDPLTSYDECYCEPDVSTGTKRTMRFKTPSASGQDTYDAIPTQDSDMNDKLNRNGKLTLKRRGTTRFHKQGELNWGETRRDPERGNDNMAFNTSP